MKRYGIAPPTDVDFSQQLGMLCMFEIYGAFDEGWALLPASSSRLPWNAMGSTPAPGLSVLCMLAGSCTPDQTAMTSVFLCACVNDCHQRGPLTESRKQIFSGKTGTNWAPLFPFSLVYLFLGLMAVLNTRTQS